MAIAEDITRELAELNVIVGALNRDRVESMKRFCDIVQTYADVQE